MALLLFKVFLWRDKFEVRIFLAFNTRLHRTILCCIFFQEKSHYFHKRVFFLQKFRLIPWIPQLYILYLHNKFL